MNSEPITLVRDVETSVISIGTKITLLKGEGQQPVSTESENN